MMKIVLVIAALLLAGCASEQEKRDAKASQRRSVAAERALLDALDPPATYARVQRELLAKQERDAE
jgi:outer membrane murein-binding lipoprotein Lpp